MTGCRCPSELEEVHYLIADKEEDIRLNHNGSVYPRILEVNSPHRQKC